MPSITPSMSARSRFGLALGVVVAVAVMGACGGGGSKSAGNATTTAGPTATTSGGSSGSSTSDQLSQIASSVSGAEKSTFKAVYTSNTNGQSSTVTIEQMPPDSLFSTGSGEVINNGTQTYFCSNSGGQNSCVSEQGASNPLAGLLEVYSPQTFLTFAQGAEAAAAAHVAGYSLTFSDTTFAGQPSKCITASGSGQSGKYCVTNSGILASVSTGSSSFSLTDFSTSVSASDFQPPQGSSVQTVPSNITLPPGQTLPQGVTIP